MNWLDIVILVAIAIFFFVGFKNGLIKTAISLAGLIAGVILAGRFSPALAALLTFLPSESIANMAAFAIIFVAVMVAASVLAFILTRVASAILMGWVNHLAGGAAGIIMGATICAALLATWLKYLGLNSVITQSGLAAILLDKLPFVLSLLPESFSSIRQFFH